MKEKPQKGNYKGTERENGRERREEKSGYPYVLLFRKGDNCMSILIGIAIYFGICSLLLWIFCKAAAKRG